MVKRSLECRLHLRRLFVSMDDKHDKTGQLRAREPEAPRMEMRQLHAMASLRHFPHAVKLNTNHNR